MSAECLQDKGLPVGLLLMMQQLVDVSTAKRTAATAAGGAAVRPAKSKKGKKAAAAEHRPEPAAAEDDQETWLSELMASLCEKVGWLVGWWVGGGQINFLSHKVRASSLEKLRCMWIGVGIGGWLWLLQGCMLRLPLCVNRYICYIDMLRVWCISSM
jgi:hypothetical protein